MAGACFVDAEGAASDRGTMGKHFDIAWRMWTAAIGLVVVVGGCTTLLGVDNEYTLIGKGGGGGSSSTEASSSGTGGSSTATSSSGTGGADCGTSVV